RFCRLYPVFFVCVVLLTINRVWRCPTFYCGLDFFNYATLHSVMLHGAVPHEWLPRSSVAMLGPSWSVSLEWQFYLFAPLIVGLLIARRFAAFAAVCALAWVASPIQWHLFGTTLTFHHEAFVL